MRAAIMSELSHNYQVLQETNHFLQPRIAAKITKQMCRMQNVMYRIQNVQAEMNVNKK
jgi:hypothetical protein